MAAPPARPDDSALRRLFRVTGSLKFAVCLLFFFAAASLLGMVVESKTDANTAREWVYNAWWFNLAFAALWWNIFAATMVRYPWPKRLTGFVITHAGLLTIIIASLITRVAGVEGQLRLEEGESRAYLEQIERDAMYVRLPDGTRHEVDGRDLRRLNPDQPRRIGDSPWAFEVTEYYMNSHVRQGYVRAPAGPPAVEVVLEGPQFGAVPRWFLPTDARPKLRRLELGILTVESQWLADAQAVAAFESPEPADDDGGHLRLRMRDGSERMVPIADLQAGPVTLEENVQVVLRRLVANAIVGTGPDGRQALVEEPDPSRGAGPAIEFAVEWADGSEEHAAFARMPNFHSRKGGHAAGTPQGQGYRGWYDLPQPPFEGKGVALGFTPTGEVRARLHGDDGRPLGEVRPLALGAKLTTPWNGIAVQVRTLLESARPHVELVDASAERIPRGFMAVPGVRLNLYGPDGMEPAWLQQFRPQEVHHPGGAVRLEWNYGRYPLDFQVTLLDFRKVDYPGTSRASSFESDVRVQDPVRGRNEQVTISMNYPMEHGGVVWWPGSDWAFYQSSFQQPEGRREVSVFSVAYDPGYGLNMVGSVLVIFGIITMFYLVPYFRPKRRKRAPAPPAADSAEAVS
ncbi:MAG: hypothetical protein ACYTGX_06585 [Planctomycetota bacterium]|jgi:hypothetical protein